MAPGVIMLEVVHSEGILLDEKFRVLQKIVTKLLKEGSLKYLK